MTIRHLRTFLAVCESGSMTRAAESLHIAQPSVSQTIAELEKYYNVTLFSRVKQRLFITEQGRALLAKAKEVISSFDEFETLAYDAKKNDSVKIGCSMTLGKVFLPLLMEETCRTLPEVELTARVEKTAVIEEMLLSGDIDLAVIEGAAHSPLLRSTAFWRDRLAFVCRYGDEAPSNLSVRDLKNYKLLLREEGSPSRELLESVLSLYGVSVTPTLTSASDSAILAAARRGIGVAVLPYALTAPYIREKSLREICSDVAFEREVSVIARKNKKFTEKQEQVYRLCLALKPDGRNSFEKGY